MKVKFDQQSQECSNLPKKWDWDINTMVKTAFLDTGGIVDSACLTTCRVDIPNRIIYVTGAKYWKIDEKDNMYFATIRNDIAKLQRINQYSLIGCETNNYGRTEMESLRREYGIKMIGINTAGKVTDPKKIRKGLSMDKEAIIQFTNSWRQNTRVDPQNNLRLGQIKFLKQKTPDLLKLVNELDTFVRKDPEGIGATGRPKFGAEGTGHDDGPMSMLGNFHMIKTQIFKIYTGNGSVGAVPNSEQRVTSRMMLPGGRQMGTINAETIERTLMEDLEN